MSRPKLPNGAKYTVHVDHYQNQPPIVVVRVVDGKGREMGRAAAEAEDAADKLGLFWQARDDAKARASEQRQAALADAAVWAAI